MSKTYRVTRTVHLSKEIEEGDTLQFNYLDIGEKTVKTVTESYIHFQDTTKRSKHVIQKGIDRDLISVDERGGSR